MNAYTGWQETSGWDDWYSASESFAYFFRGGTVSQAGEAQAGTSHVCEFLQRDDSDYAVVRLDAPIRGRWQDVRVPVKRLDYMSRPDRQAMLQALSAEDLWDLAVGYGLRLRDRCDPVQLILEFEFSRFASAAA